MNEVDLGDGITVVNVVICVLRLKLIAVLLH